MLDHFTAASFTNTAKGCTINGLNQATTSGSDTIGYGALSRMTSQGGPLGTMAIQYDAAGERTRLPWPDTFYVAYDYDSAGNLMHARENGAVLRIGVLATFSHDDLGRRTKLTRGNGTSTSYTPDAVSRLASLAHTTVGFVLVQQALDDMSRLGRTQPGVVGSTTMSAQSSRSNQTRRRNEG